MFVDVEGLVCGFESDSCLKICSATCSVISNKTISNEIFFEVVKILSTEESFSTKKLSTWKAIT